MVPYIGQLLDDRYEILEVLGTGGMAVVYKAMCHRLNRLVAVKVLKEEYSGDEEFRKRFRAEGEAVAMLSHPNIVQVFDVSASDDANYIVMELIDGVSLKQYMDAKGVLNWKETLHFSTQIAKGLEHAHGRGIVHRDIKPHNVMVLKNGSVKVMDFGIAQVMNKRSTLTKEALGSVHYISPEQARGSYTDNRSDIYSLGVVMYEMMTGRPPYDGENPVAVAIQHINGGAVRPSALNPNIPAAMEQLIMRAMALDPKDRFISATEMLHDMEEFRKNPGVTFHYNLKLVEPKAGTRRPEPPRPTPARERPDTGSTKKLNETDPDREGRKRKRQLADERRKREAERSRTIAIAVVTCSLVAIIAIVVFLVAIFNGALTNEESKLVEIPYLVGQIYNEDYLTLYPDLKLRLQAQQYDNVYSQGQIMKQEPVGGSKVKKGTELYITISMGEEPKIKLMEDLVGVTQDRAYTFLLGQGLKPLIRDDYSDDYPQGYVFRTDPEADAELVDGQTVKLWVSTGPNRQTAKMPNVLELTGDGARSVLESLGFRNITVTPIYSNRDKGTVISQNQTANSVIDLNAHIVLEVSDGPRPSATKMPDVLALDEESAYSLLRQLGFSNVYSYNVVSDKIQGQVVAQSVEPNVDVELGQEIYLGVSRGLGESSSIHVTFSIPSRQEEYDLIICHHGQMNSQIASARIPPWISSYTVELIDSGIQEYDLFINGAFYQTQKVDFTGNG